jgi:hypothetical protein
LLARAVDRDPILSGLEHGRQRIEQMRALVQNFGAAHVEQYVVADFELDLVADRLHRDQMGDALSFGLFAQFAGHVLGVGGARPSGRQLGFDGDRQLDQGDAAPHDAAQRLCQFPELAFVEGGEREQ